MSNTPEHSKPHQFSFFKAEPIPQSDVSHAIYRPKTRPNWWSSRIPEWIGAIPVVGDIAGYVTLAEVAWNDAREAFRGDPIRMRDEMKDKSLEEQLPYIHSYLVTDYDPLNNMVKEAYHNKRGWRFMRGVAIDAALFAMGFIPKFVPATEPAEGVLEVVRGYGTLDGAKNLGLAVREFHESHRVEGRRSVQKYIENAQADAMGTDEIPESLAKKISGALDFLEIQPEDQISKDVITSYIVKSLIGDLQARQDAFDRLTKKDKRNAKKVARRLEKIDWRIENPGRPAALLRRLHPFARRGEHHWERKEELKEKRVALRNRGWYYNQQTARYENPTPESSTTIIVAF